MFVLILLILSLLSSAYVLVKMLREIRDAETIKGKEGNIPLLAAFGGAMYLFHRYGQSVPNGRTPLWFLLLVPANVILLGLYLVLSPG